MQPNPQEEHNKARIQKMVTACQKFQNVFSGTGGEEVLAMIEAEIPKIVFNKDPFITANNLGKKELFEFILNSCDDKKLQNNVEQMKKMCKENK